MKTVFLIMAWLLLFTGAVSWLFQTPVPVAACALASVMILPVIWIANRYS